MELAVDVLEADIGAEAPRDDRKRLIGLAPGLRNLLLAINASALYLGMSLGAAAGSRAWVHLGPWSLPAVALVFIGCSLTAFLLSRRAELRAPALLGQA